MTPWERPEALRGLRWAIAGVIAAYLAVVALTIAGSRLAAYPLMHPDSYDWLANALRYTGVPVDSTWRVPFPPFVYAALFALGLDDLIPFLGLAAVLGTVVMLLTLGWRAAGAAALWAALLVAANHLVLGHALSVQPDVWSAALGLTGILALAVALDLRAPAYLYAAAAALALGGLAQPATPFLAPACLVMLLYDPEAPRGMGLGGVRWLVREPAAWGAVGLAAAILAAPLAVRWLLVGIAWPTSKVARAYYIEVGVFPDLIGFYAWASMADWSIPVTVLAVVGAVYGLRRPSWRRLTLGLLLAIAGNVAMFGLVYTAYRENRFVVYWTLPALLLAGIGLRSLRLPVALVVGAVALVATNLSSGMWGRPGTEPVLVLWPNRVLEARFSTVERPWTTEWSNDRARLFPATLARWMAVRERLFARRDGDDVFYSRAREILGRLAAFHVRPDETLYLHFAPDENPTHLYMLWNQFALFARRRTESVVLDHRPALGANGGPAVVVLRRAELDRLRDGGIMPGQVRVLEERGRWVLIRLERPQAPTPASSRKMSSIERVSSHPG